MSETYVHVGCGESENESDATATDHGKVANSCCDWDDY